MEVVWRSAGQAGGALAALPAHGGEGVEQRAPQHAHHVVQVGRERGAPQAHGQAEQLHERQAQLLAGLGRPASRGLGAREARGERGQQARQGVAGPRGAPQAQVQQVRRQRAAALGRVGQAAQQARQQQTRPRALEGGGRGGGVSVGRLGPRCLESALQRLKRAPPAQLAVGLQPGQQAAQRAAQLRRLGSFRRLGRLSRSRGRRGLRR